MKPRRLLSRVGLAILLWVSVAPFSSLAPLSAQPAPQALRPVVCEPSSAADDNARIPPNRPTDLALESGLGRPRVLHWLYFPVGAVSHETVIRFRVFRGSNLMIELGGENGPLPAFRPGTEPTLTLDVELCETGSQNYLLHMGASGLRPIAPDSISGSRMYFKIPSFDLFMLARQ